MQLTIPATGILLFISILFVFRSFVFGLDMCGSTSLQTSCLLYHVPNHVTISVIHQLMENVLETATGEN